MTSDSKSVSECPLITSSSTSAPCTVLCGSLWMHLISWIPYWKSMSFHPTPSLSLWLRLTEGFDTQSSSAPCSVMDTGLCEERDCSVYCFQNCATGLKTEYESLTYGKCNYIMFHKGVCACAVLVAKVHGQWLNPITFSKSIPKEHTHIRNNRKAVLKTADHPATPTQPSSITLRLTPAVCLERTEQLEA